MMTQSPLPSHDQLDFNFSTASSSPYVTAPSSPQPFFVGASNTNYFYTSPPRPARISAASSTAFSSFHLIDDHDDSSEEEEDTADFAFDFSGHLETPQHTLSADELFYAGVIKPLQVPPQQPQRGRSSEAKNKSFNAQQRKTSSTLRVSDILLDGSKESSTAWYYKWSLMFGSKSEGATKKGKWAVEKGKSEVDLKNGSMRRKGMMMSRQELHYRENRGAAEEMRKKTPLAYKHVEKHGWLLGCLGFSPPNFDHPHHSSYY